MNLKSSTGMLPYGLGGSNVTACDEVHSGLQAAARWITCILLLGRFHALKQRVSSAEETDTDAASMSSALGPGMAHGGNGAPVCRSNLRIRAYCVSWKLSGTEPASLDAELDN